MARYTTDADIAIDPSALRSDRPWVREPRGGFVAGDQPGLWRKKGVHVDSIVPEALCASQPE